MQANMYIKKKNAYDGLIQHLENTIKKAQLISARATAFSYLVGIRRLLRRRLQNICHESDTAINCIRLQAQILGSHWKNYSKM
jgi:hypothetical protein